MLLDNLWASRPGDNARALAHYYAPEIVGLLTRGQTIGCREQSLRPGQVVLAVNTFVSKKSCSPEESQGSQ